MPGRSGGPGRSRASSPVWPSRAPPAPPNRSRNTRCTVSMCSGPDANVARAHRHSSYWVAGRASGTARANRSQRPGPAGTRHPAVPRRGGRRSAPDRPGPGPCWSGSRWRGGYRRPRPRRGGRCRGSRTRPQSPSPAAAANPASRRTCRSSEYLSTTPAVWAATVSPSRSAPSTTRASAQLIASATPGGLARSRSASRAIPPGHLPGQWLRRGGYPAADDRRDPFGVRVLDPVVEAAPLQRVVQVPGPVGGEHHDRRHRGPPGAELGDRDRRLGEQLEQERLELVVTPVHLVDEQYGGPRAGMVQRGQQRPGQQVVGAEQVRVAERLAAGLGQPDREQLARVVPLVQGLGRGQALVALQPDQRRVERPPRAPWLPRSCRPRARPQAGSAGPSGRPGTAPRPAAGR